VVTGEGRLETCSPNQQPQLFESVLAGLGQYGIILQATIRLIPAKVNARVFRLFYPTLAALVQDEAMVTRESDGRFDAVLGYVVVTPQNEWGYMLEVATFYASLADQPDNNRLLSDLGFLRGMEQIEETTYFNFRNRVDAVVTAFKEMGVWDYAHPWFDVFIPTPAVVDYVNNVLATTSPAESQLDTILLYPFNANRFSRPLLRLPDAESFFLFDLLRTRPPDSEVISQVIAHNRVLFEQSRKLGGMHYPIGMIDLSQKDWETHYGSCWEQVVQMKQRFDPDHLLTPSQGIFPS
jgi:FAD/FMN-containing dehydrogenase